MAESETSTQTTSERQTPPPALPERVTRWTVDRHYTALVAHLMATGEAGPSEVADEAKTLMLSQARTRLDAHDPDAPMPDEFVRFGVAEETQ